MTTTSETTVRQALKTIRGEMAGESYLPAVREYECDAGTLMVRNAKSSDGGRLLGVFEAELVDARGQTVRTYDV